MLPLSEELANARAVLLRFAAEHDAPMEAFAALVTIDKAVNELRQSEAVYVPDDDPFAWPTGPKVGF